MAPWPGLLVNVGFTMRRGRARPRNVVDFGGSAQLSPPLQIAGQCSGSFVSGEASAAFKVVILPILIFLPLFRARQRGFALAPTGAVAVSGSELRAAFGAPSTSDIILIALIATASTSILYMVARTDRVGNLMVAGPLRKTVHTDLRR